MDSDIPDEWDGMFRVVSGGNGPSQEVTGNIRIRRTVIGELSICLSSIDQQRTAHVSGNEDAATDADSLFRRDALT